MVYSFLSGRGITVIDLVRGKKAHSLQSKSRRLLRTALPNTWLSTIADHLRQTDCADVRQEGFSAPRIFFQWKSRQKTFTYMQVLYYLGQNLVRKVVDAHITSGTCHVKTNRKRVCCVL